MNGKRASQDELIEMIMDEHKPIQRLIQIMKDTDNELSEREEAFEKFAPLLVAHAKPEEDTVYAFMKKTEDLREEGFEGEVEHILADQMLEECRRADDDDIFSAKLKVLAELVEHHIEEEESELLPSLKKSSSKEERNEILQQFLEAKQEILDEGGMDSPSERDTDNTHPTLMLNR